MNLVASDNSLSAHDRWNQILDEDIDIDQPANMTITHSGRISRAPQKLSLQQLTSPDTSIVEEYTLENARVIAKVMSLMDIGVIETTVKTNHQFTQTFKLSRGTRKFGDKGCQAAEKDMEQFHERNAFDPVHVDDITTIE
jgi:hypothetical protein